MEERLDRERCRPSHVPAGRLHTAATCATLAQSNPSSRLPATSISFEASAAAFGMASSAAAAAEEAMLNAASGGFQGDGGRWQSARPRVALRQSGAGRGGVQPTGRNVASWRHRYSRSSLSSIRPALGGATADAGRRGAAQHRLVEETSRE